MTHLAKLRHKKNKTLERLSTAVVIVGVILTGLKVDRRRYRRDLLFDEPLDFF